MSRYGLSPSRSAFTPKNDIRTVRSILTSSSGFAWSVGTLAGGTLSITSASPLWSIASLVAASLTLRKVSFATSGAPR